MASGKLYTNTDYTKHTKSEKEGETGKEQENKAFSEDDPGIDKHIENDTELIIN